MSIRVPQGGNTCDEDSTSDEDEPCEEEVDRENRHNNMTIE